MYRSPQYETHFVYFLIVVYLPIVVTLDSTLATDGGSGAMNVA